MRKIARIIFKLHRYIYGYPCRSEVRLALDVTDTMVFGLTSTVGMLYICGEDVEGICDWVDLNSKQVKEELNDIVMILGDTW